MFLIIYLDLQTLESNLEKGKYQNRADFMSDLIKIFTNAKLFNRPSTIFHKYAKELEILIEDEIRELKDA